MRWCSGVWVAGALWVVGCGGTLTPTMPDAAVDARADVTVDVTVDVGADVMDVAAPDTALDARADAADADVAVDARSDASESGADVPADATCSGAVAGAPCAPDGASCGGPCTDPCMFCNVLRCVSGRWERLEVPPLPPDMCRDAGVDAADGSAEGLNCDPRAALCDVLPPPCMGGGEVREVRGGCWGDCVVYTRCRPIACDPDMTGQCPTNTVCFRTTRQCGLPVM